MDNTQLELGKIDAHVGRSPAGNTLHDDKRQNPTAVSFETLISIARNRITDLNERAERRSDALRDLKEARRREDATLREYDEYFQKHTQFLKDFEKNQPVQATETKQDEVKQEGVHDGREVYVGKQSFEDMLYADMGHENELQ